MHDGAKLNISRDAAVKSVIAKLTEFNVVSRFNIHIFKSVITKDVISSNTYNKI